LKLVGGGDYLFRGETETVILDLCRLWDTEAHRAVCLYVALKT